MEMEISKAKIKLVASLRKTRARRETGLFCVEGHKAVVDSLPCFSLELMVATREWLEANTPEGVESDRIYSASSRQMDQMTGLSTAAPVMALFRMPAAHVPTSAELESKITLLLDGIQDPGNLGTIVRCADWFGVENIVCSPQTADIFSAKAIQATMGALARVNVSYTSLPEFILSHKELPLIGTLLEGSSLYETAPPRQALLVMGNEGRGLTEEVKSLLTQSLFIPPYPSDAPTVESLNVAMATAIVLARFRNPNL